MGVSREMERERERERERESVCVEKVLLFIYMTSYNNLHDLLLGDTLIPLVCYNEARTQFLDIPHPSNYPKSQVFFSSETQPEYTLHHIVVLAKHKNSLLFKRHTWRFFVWFCLQAARKKNMKIITKRIAMHKNWRKREKKNIHSHTYKQTKKK